MSHVITRQHTWNEEGLEAATTQVALVREHSLSKDAESFYGVWESTGDNCAAEPWSLIIKCQSPLLGRALLPK